MKIYRSLDDYPRNSKGSVLTIGNFDGVHLGHQEIISRARRLADREGLPLVGMTFDPAPVRILKPQQSPEILTPLGIKVKLLAEQGVDELIIIPTTGEFLALDPARFVEEVLVTRLQVKHVVEGPTFNFGSRRSGTAESLEDLSQRYHFQAHLTPARTLVLEDGSTATLSSTLIREWIKAGRFGKVRESLGRDYGLVGRVVSGRGVGRALGYPTANLEPVDREQLVPNDGVFAGYAQWGGDLEQAWNCSERQGAAISIGECETFADGQWQIEAYLLDYPPDGPDMHEQIMVLWLREYIREQRAFASAEELGRVIGQDCEKIRQLLPKT